MAEAVAGTDAEGGEDVGELLLVGLLPPSGVEVLGVGEVLLVVHVLGPAGHHDVAE